MSKAKTRFGKSVTLHVDRSGRRSPIDVASTEIPTSPLQSGDQGGSTPVAEKSTGHVEQSGLLRKIRVGCAVLAAATAGALQLHLLHEGYQSASSAVNNILPDTSSAAGNGAMNALGLKDTMKIVNHGKTAVVTCPAPIKGEVRLDYASENGAQTASIKESRTFSTDNGGEDRKLKEKVYSADLRDLKARTAMLGLVKVLCEDKYPGQVPPADAANKNDQAASASATTTPSTVKAAATTVAPKPTTATNNGSTATTVKKP